MPPPSPASQALAKKLLGIGACKEGREWIEAGNFAEYRPAWRACPAPEFMCWLATRTMGVDGVRACLACVKQAAQAHAKDAIVKATFVHTLDVLEGRSTDRKRLQVLAYDATESALSKKQASGPALLSVAYGAYAVHHLLLSNEDKDPPSRMKHLLKAAQHSSDAASHAIRALPPKSGPLLANLVRQTINEETAYRAWQATIAQPPVTPAGA
jgi:hypothetical protein